MPTEGHAASQVNRAGTSDGGSAPTVEAPVPERRVPPFIRRATQCDRYSGGTYGQLPPEQSARELIWTWQRIALGACALAASGLVLFDGDSGVALLALTMSVPFAFGAVIRLLAVAHAAAPESYAREWAKVHTVEDFDLPRYTVLVPLFREVQVVPGLVAALSEIDYPPARLEVLIVVEEIDLETQVAIAAEVMPSHMRMVVVPDGAPRTKPRAINHALAETSGDYVVVFDAEDLPEPDQLKRALAVLRSDPERIGCVQACLNVYNSDACWLTRQFTLEYTALFDLLLPALDRFGLVVPLGGTSNHFPRRVLDEMRGWDAYNVTEDADLGIRLARAGYRVATLGSTTWEECPDRFRVWLGQRTRWLKGWMQTWLVHTRRPGRLAAELGWWRFIMLQLLLANLVLSPLVHPWFYVLLAGGLMAGRGLGPPEGLLFASVWWIAAFNVAVGYALAVMLGAIAVARRGWPELIPSALSVPFYWLAISFAAYRALYQLVRAPHYWEKTEHGQRSRPATAKAS